ncbi:MAG: enoyl-CoA hydratase-related protein [Clostridiales bacterium]|nr:enoyl-CoA hydratase-related protein [Clostridiales bacterium]
MNTLKTERIDDIMVVKFNRPQALNAMNAEMTGEIVELFDELAKDDSVRGIIVTGEGRAFMAGADITEMAAWDAEGGREFARFSNYALSKIADISKPVIYAVNGYALGGGLELSLCGDWRIAADNAIFASPEVSLGIIPSGGGTQRLARLIGSGRAKELIFTARKITAEEAEKIGLVNKVVPADKLMDEAIASMKMALSNSSTAIRLAKEVIDSGLDMDLNNGIKAEINAVGMAFANEEKTEGVSAFLEKRKPNFNNR